MSQTTETTKPSNQDLNTVADFIKWFIQPRYSCIQNEEFKEKHIVDTLSIYTEMQDILQNEMITMADLTTYLIQHDFELSETSLWICWAKTK